MRVCPACDHRFDASVWSCPRCGRGPERRGEHPVFAPSLTDSDGYDAAFFSRLAALEPGNYWFEARNRLLVWALRRYFPTARSFFEIGCGTGFVLAGIRAALPALQLAGAEIFSEGLAYAQARVPGTTLFQMDARHIPFEDEFDVIGAFDVLEHIDDDEAVLVQMRRAVRTGGGILLTVPQHPRLGSTVDAHAHHKRRYRRSALLDKVRDAGFHVLRATSFVSLLLPAMVLSRLARRAGRRADDPLPELGVGATTNALLARVLGAERAFITRGVSFPVGGSLMIVARTS